jgi:hypothetical protein
MGYLIRGRIPKETANPVNRFLIAIYRPALEAVLRFPKATLAIAAVVLAVLAIDDMPGGRRMLATDGVCDFLTEMAAGMQGWLLFTVAAISERLG